MIWSKMCFISLAAILGTCVTDNVVTNPPTETDSETPSLAAGPDWVTCENEIQYPDPDNTEYRVSPAALGRYYSNPQAPIRAKAVFQTNEAAIGSVGDIRSRDDSSSLVSGGSANVQVQTPQQTGIARQVQNAASREKNTSIEQRRERRAIPEDSRRVADDPNREPHQPIFGGSIAEPHFHPWAAHLSIITKKSQNTVSYDNFCGAALVADRWLLTAAHCVNSEYLRTSVTNMGPDFNVDVVAINVKMGRSDLDDTSIETGTVEKSYCHSAFNPETFENDIALLKLSSPVEFSNYREHRDTYIRPGHLPLQSSDILPHQSTQQEVMSVGWGLTETAQVSPLLIEASMSVDQATITASSSLFASDPSAESGHACRGDSGSPVVVIEDALMPEDRTLVGINSNITGNTSGNSCDSSGITTWFTRVANYRTSIDDFISQ